MNDVLFDIVFKGKFISAIDKPTAILRFAKIFKLPKEKAEMFFDGNPRVLKKSMNMDKASSFRKALKKAGLRVSLNKIQDTANAKPELTMSEPGVVLVNKPFIQPKVFDVKQFSLDEVGATLVTYTPIEKKHFDIDDIQVDDVGSTMAEKQEVPELDLDISDLSMDEVGSVFAEKENIQAPEFNLDDLDMDDVGSIMAEKEKVPEPDIDIDNIKLAD